MSGAHLNQFVLRKIVYDPAVQIDLIRDILAIYLPPLQSAVSRDEANVVYGLCGTLAIVLAWAMLCFKDPAFNGEAEWRVMHISGRGNAQWPVKYRAAPRAIVPYVELSLVGSQDSVLQIATVIVGPALERGTNLDSIGQLIRQSSPECVVEPSKIPFRNVR